MYVTGILRFFRYRKRVTLKYYMVGF
jgi:hypothetical protein